MPARSSPSRLIWLDYLRARERRVTLEGLAIYVPARPRTLRRAAPPLPRPAGGALRTLRLRRGRPDRARRPARPRQSRYTPRPLPPSRAQPAGPLERPSRRCPEWSGSPSTTAASACASAASSSPNSPVASSASASSERRAARPHHAAEIERLAAELARARVRTERASAIPAISRGVARIAGARGDRMTLDASLLPSRSMARCRRSPPAIAACSTCWRSIGRGRLVVIELKATADLHLPMQALDYWIRVKWHLDRGEFSACGYFPGNCAAADPPRLLLVSPSLDFHPTTETILGYFSPARRCGANRRRSRMAEGPARDVSPSRRATARVTLLC